MSILKTISLLFVCFALVTGSVANAAMPCCMKMDSSAKQMQMDDNADSNMDMPCHQKAEKDTKTKADCKGCSCMHCVKMSAMPEQPSAAGEVASSVQTFGTQSVHSCQPEGVFQPPKQLS